MKDVTLEYCIGAYERNWVSICNDGQVVAFKSERKDQPTGANC